MAIQKVPTASFHPGYGCAIMLIAILTFGGMISWVIYSGYEQDRQFATFTIEKAPPLQSATPSAEEKDVLKKRLADFAKASTSVPTTLTLTLADLNNLVALYDERVEKKDPKYGGMIWFTGMDEKKQALLGDIHFQINNMPLTDRPDRFLVGHATFKPALDTKSLELRIDEVEVPGKKISEGFLAQLQQWPWLNLAKTKAEVSTVLASVTAADITPEGTLILKAMPPSKPSPPK